MKMLLRFFGVFLFSSLPAFYAYEQVKEERLFFCRELWKMPALSVLFSLPVFFIYLPSPPAITLSFCFLFGAAMFVLQIAVWELRAMMIKKHLKIGNKF